MRELTRALRCVPDTSRDKGTAFIVLRRFSHNFVEQTAQYAARDICKLILVLYLDALPEHLVNTRDCTVIYPRHALCTRYLWYK